MNAWLIRPNGFVRKFGKDETIDRIADPNDIYNEYRVRTIDATEIADAGVIFGYQATIEERPLFDQDIWRAQSRLPVLQSRYSLNLPSGWRSTSVTFNHEKIEPTVTGSSYVWELRNLDPIKAEPSSPLTSSLAPIIALSYYRADSGISNTAFETWDQVSKWGSSLHDPASTPDDAVAAKARELTVNSKTELDRIKAIASFVQGLQYISIDIGLGRGNGYRPHPPAQVLSKSYGDCKDKANLMRTMLRAVNITAYPIFIFLGDPTHVREEWPSPIQFNHCIVAIKVSDETQGPTVISSPKLGRLLIFDATDESTSVGDLPEEEQGSMALIVAGENGQLVKMPTLPPESSKVQRQTTVELSADGSIQATLRETAKGQSAANFRREFRYKARPEYERAIEGWISSGMTSAKLLKVEAKDNKAEGDFDLQVEFASAVYGQLMQNRLLVFKPVIVSRREALAFVEPSRKYPIVLDSQSFEETTHIKLPSGFTVDELPDPLKQETAYGSYETKYEVVGSELVFKRMLSLRSARIPADQYQSVRGFFEKIRTAEQSPVVLARK
jgi:hypothetical protein